LKLHANKYLALHFIILLWGFTPVLGKLISLQALDLVWWRLLLSCISLYVFIKFKGVDLTTNFRDLMVFFFWGAIIGFHWYFFYHAIKVSNVSIALAGFATITLFASFIQPIFLKKRFYWADVIYSLVIIAGILTILNFERFYALGLIYGVLAAVTAALFGIYNGKLILKHNSSKITFYEFVGAFITLSILIGINGVEKFVLVPETSDLVYLLILSVVCTTLAFTLSVEILKYIDPLTVIITNNLEPIYGVVFSILIFGQSELMSAGFYIGAAIILAAVFSYPFIKEKYFHYNIS